MNDSFARALLFVRQGRYREAESYLRTAIQNDPEDPQGFFFLATCLMHDPNTRPEALSMIDQALRLRPTRAFYHAQRANILILLSRTKEALLEVEQARSLAPDSPDSYVAESLVMLVLGKPQEAERAARQALGAGCRERSCGRQLGGRAQDAGQAGGKCRANSWIIGKEPGKSMDSLVGWDAGASAWRGAGSQKRTFYRPFESSLNIGRREKDCCTRFVRGPRFIVRT